jgi:hypothetical protein
MKAAKFIYGEKAPIKDCKAISGKHHHPQAFATQI